jgi:hypothetical protein
MTTDELATLIRELATVQRSEMDELTEEMKRGLELAMTLEEIDSDLEVTEELTNRLEIEVTELTRKVRKMEDVTFVVGAIATLALALAGLSWLY